MLRPPLPDPGSSLSGTTQVHGQVTPGFAPVEAAFREIFQRDGESGAAVCVYRRGRKVVDLWGGWRDARARLPWEQDTIVPVLSTGKGAIAAACAVAVSRGQFAYDDPVARHWPGFARHGKDAVTIRHVLEHSAGLPLFGRRVEARDFDDPQGMSDILDDMRLIWEPGTACGYHLATWGFLLSQLITRTDPAGRPLARYFADEVAGPLGLDLHFGLPDEAARARLAMVSIPAVAQLSDAVLHGPFALHQQLLNPLSLFHQTLREIALPLDEITWLSHDFPSANAVGTARSIALLYSDLAHQGAGLKLNADVAGELLGPSQYEEARLDKVMGVGRRWHLGFVRPDPDFPFSPVPEAFGMPGLGGSFGFCDPQRMIGYGFTPGRLGLLPFDDQRDRRLRLALEACLDTVGDADEAGDLEP